MNTSRPLHLFSILVATNISLATAYICGFEAWSVALFFTISYFLALPVRNFVWGDEFLNLPKQIRDHDDTPMWFYFFGKPAGDHEKIKSILHDFRKRVSLNRVRWLSLGLGVWVVFGIYLVMSQDTPSIPIFSLLFVVGLSLILHSFQGVQLLLPLGLSMLLPLIGILTTEPAKAWIFLPNLILFLMALTVFKRFSRLTNSPESRLSSVAMGAFFISVMTVIIYGLIKPSPTQSEESLREKMIDKVAEKIIEWNQDKKIESNQGPTLFDSASDSTPTESTSQNQYPPGDRRNQSENHQAGDHKQGSSQRKQRHHGPSEGLQDPNQQTNGLPGNQSSTQQQAQQKQQLEQLEKSLQQQIRQTENQIQQARRSGKTPKQTQRSSGHASTSGKGTSPRDLALKNQKLNLDLKRLQKMAEQLEGQGAGSPDTQIPQGDAGSLNPGGQQSSSSNGYKQSLEHLKQLEKHTQERSKQSKQQMQEIAKELKKQKQSPSGKMDPEKIAELQNLNQESQQLQNDLGQIQELARQMENSNSRSQASQNSESGNAPNRPPIARRSDAEEIKQSKESLKKKLDEVKKTVTNVMDILFVLLKIAAFLFLGYVVYRVFIYLQNRDPDKVVKKKKKPKITEEERQWLRHKFQTLKRKNLSPEEEVKETYRLYLQAMHLMEFPRETWRTATDFQKDVSAEFDVLNSSSDVITEAFCDLSYGKKTVSQDDIQQLRQARDQFFQNVA